MYKEVLATPMKHIANERLFLEPGLDFPVYLREKIEGISENLDEDHPMKDRYTKLLRSNLEDRAVRTAVMKFLRKLRHKINGVVLEAGALTWKTLESLDMYKFLDSTTICAEDEDTGKKTKKKISEGESTKLTNYEFQY